MNDAELKSGYLLKRGRGINYSYIRPWDRRWVTLDVSSGEMIYYEDIMGSTRAERGRLYLGGCEVVALEEEAVGKPFAFEVFFNASDPRSKSKVGITLACKSMAELMSWVEAVQKAAEAPPVEFTGKGEDGAESLAAAKRAAGAGAGAAPRGAAEGGTAGGQEGQGPAYDMADIDEDDYVPPQPAAEGHTQEQEPIVMPPPSSFADIDDEPAAPPAVIVMHPPEKAGADSGAGGGMEDIDDDVYSPKDIDEEEGLPGGQQEAPRGGGRGPSIRPQPSFDSATSEVSRDGRPYLSPSLRQQGEPSDWWEPGGGESSAAAAREFGENLQIRIKIRRLEHRYSRLSRRLHATRVTAGFSSGCDIQAMRALLGQLYRGAAEDVGVDRAEWTALFAAMFVAEEGEPPPPARAQLGDLRVVILAEVSPGQHRLEVAVRPWDMLPDIAAALADTLSIPQPVAEAALNRGMGEMGSGKRFSLYPKAVELLMEELCAAERCVLTHESMMLNMAAGDGAHVPAHSHRNSSDSQLRHDFNTPYVPSFLGHADEEFHKADEDGDGFISRAEWRKWITEKEKIIRLHNNEKAYLIKETRSLRKALSPVQEQAYEALMQSESRREEAETSLAERTQEHRKALSELARAKIRVAQLEATVAAYEESGAQVSCTLSLQKLHNAIATDMAADANENSFAGSEVSSSRQGEEYETYAGMNENNYDNYSNNHSTGYTPGPQSWVRNYVSPDIDYAAGRVPDIKTVPPSIAEVNRHKSGETLSVKGARDLKATLARLGRDTTLQVVTGVYPSSSNSPKNDLGHWDTVNLQTSSKRRSPGREHVLHQALRSAQPSPTEKMSLNSRGNVSVMHKIFEERERQRAMGSPLGLSSPELAQARHRKNLRRDYMAPTVTSSGKEKPGMTSPTTACKGASGWF